MRYRKLRFALSVISNHRKSILQVVSCVAAANAPLLLLATGLGGPLLLLCQLWLNIPGNFLWRRLGKSYFYLHSFGVTPITPLAWMLVSSFWTVIALAIV